MRLKIRVPHGDHVRAVFTRVPLTMTASVVGAALVYIILVLSGTTWWVALGTVTTAWVLAYVVVRVPRNTILPNQVDHLSEDEQEALFRQAHSERMAKRQQLIAAGVIPVDDETEEG